MRLFLLFFFCFEVLFGQVSKTTSYLIGNNGGDISTSHLYASDHSKYLVTLQTMPVGAISNGIGVTKLNECDEVEWSNIYVKHAHPVSRVDIIQEKGSSNIYITGLYNVQGERYLIVVKLDDLGNILFSKYYDFGNYLISNYYTNYVTDEGIVISAKYSPLGGGSSNTTLLHIDKNGDLLHSSMHYHTYTGISVAQVSDQTYIHRSSNYIYQVNTSGQIDWAKQYGTGFAFSNFFNIVTQDDGYVMVINKSSDHFLAKVDLNGDLLWVTDIKILKAIPPVIVGTKDNNILMCTYIDHNTESVPLLITYDSDGNVLKEEIITDLGVDVFNYSSISKSPNGNINLAYPSGFDQIITYIQNVEHSQCREEISIPEVENLWDVSHVDYPPANIAFPLTASHDIDMQIWDLFVEDSIRCEPIYSIDTLYTTGYIDCDSGYTYSGSDHSTYYWHHDQSTDQDKTLDTVGIYQVDIENCFSKTVEFITIESICGCELKAPNVFTPNGDTYNDVFQVVDHCGIDAFEIYIYDRWGKRIFHSKDINISWDGTYNGNAVKSDVYVYKVQYTPLSISPLVQPKILEGTVIVLY